MSNNMYDHYIKQILNSFERVRTDKLANKILDQQSEQFNNHIRNWWTSKALQPADPLRMLFIFNKEHDGCCQCYFTLASQVIVSHYSKEYGKLHTLPHTNNKIQMTTNELMRDMQLYQFMD